MRRPLPVSRHLRHSYTVDCYGNGAVWQLQHQCNGGCLSKTNRFHQRRQKYHDQPICETNGDDDLSLALIELERLSAELQSYHEQIVRETSFRSCGATVRDNVDGSLKLPTSKSLPLPLPPNPVPPLLTGSTSTLYDNCSDYDNLNVGISNADEDRHAASPNDSNGTEQFVQDFEIVSQFSLTPDGIDDSPGFFESSSPSKLVSKLNAVNVKQGINNRVFDVKTSESFPCGETRTLGRDCGGEVRKAVSFAEHVAEYPVKKCMSSDDGIAAAAATADFNRHKYTAIANKSADEKLVHYYNSLPLKRTAEAQHHHCCHCDKLKSRRKPCLDKVTSFLQQRQLNRDAIVMSYFIDHDGHNTNKGRPLSYTLTEWEEPKLEIHHKTDRYGFIHDMRLPESYTEEEARLVKKQAEREHKWKKMLARWEKVPRDKLQSRIYKGIPDSFRSGAWAKLLGVAEMRQRHPNLFESMLKYGLVHSRHVRQMDIDINRTFRDHIMFRERYGVKQRQLFHVLVAFSVFNPEVGYCQGMSTLAAFLLMYFESEEDCFLALVILFTGREVDGGRISKYRMHGFYIDGFPKFQRFREHHAILVRRYLPRLHKHFEKVGFKSEIYLLKWLLDVFIGGIPVSLLLRIWDIFLFEGERILAAFAFCIVKMHEKRLLKQRQIEDLMGYFHGLANNFGAGDDVVIQCLQTTVDDLIRDKMLLPFQPAKLKGPPPTEMPHYRLGVLPPEAGHDENRGLDQGGTAKCPTPVMEDVIVVSASSATADVQQLPSAFSSPVALQTSSPQASAADRSAGQQQLDSSSRYQQTSVVSVQVSSISNEGYAVENYLETSVTNEPSNTSCYTPTTSRSTNNNYALSSIENSPLSVPGNVVSQHYHYIQQPSPQTQHYSPQQQPQHQRFIQQQQQHQESLLLYQQQQQPQQQSPLQLKQQQYYEQLQQSPLREQQRHYNQESVDRLSGNEYDNTQCLREEEEAEEEEHSPLHDSHLNESLEIVNSSAAAATADEHGSRPDSSRLMNVDVASDDGFFKEESRNYVQATPTNNSMNERETYPSYVMFQPLKSVSETLSAARSTTGSGSTGVDPTFSLAFAQAKMERDLRDAEQRRQRHQQARAEFFRAMLASGSLYSRGSTDCDTIDIVTAGAGGGNGHALGPLSSLEDANQPAFTVIPVIDESPTHSFHQMQELSERLAAGGDQMVMMMMADGEQQNSSAPSGNNAGSRGSQSVTRRSSGGGGSRRSSKQPSHSSSFVVVPVPNSVVMVESESEHDHHGALDISTISDRLQAVHQYQQGAEEEEEEVDSNMLATSFIGGDDNVQPQTADPSSSGHRRVSHHHSSAGASPMKENPSSSRKMSSSSSGGPFYPRSVHSDV